MMNFSFTGQLSGFAILFLVSFLLAVPSHADEKELLLATTTSTDNTG